MGTSRAHTPAADVVVAEWRRRVLERAGFPHALAVTVARDTRYDLYALVGLVGRGCPPPLAQRILAPITDGRPSTEETP
jgi:hypothetical protein